MKISARDVTILQTLSIAAITGLTVVSMFFPNVLKNEQSIQSIEEKKVIATTLADDLENAESEVTFAEDRLLSQQVYAKEKNRESSRVKAGIEGVAFNLHMPSILIALEQKAKEFDLSLLIDYENIQKSANLEDMPMDDEYVEDELLDEAGREILPEDDIEEDIERDIEENIEEDLGMGGPELSDADKEETSVEEETSAPTRPTVDKSVAMDNIPYITGINVTTIPLDIEGSYANVRKFVLYLDEIDFMEHNLMDLYSFGDKLSGVMVINVFHEGNEGGGPFE